MNRFEVQTASSANSLTPSLSHHLPNHFPGRREFLANLSRSMLALGAVCASNALPGFNSQSLAQSPSAQSPKRANHLQSPQGIEELATRTRIVLQLSGKLKVADPNPASKKPPREAEVKAESTVDFDERICMNPENEVVAAARHYHEAGVKTWVANNAISHSLRQECTDTRLARFEDTWQQYCPSRPLTPREIDLVRLPINSVVIDQLLPKTPVKANDSWSPSESILAEVFQLDAVHKTTLACRVTKVENSVATIDCTGDIEGSVNGVGTKLQINGNLNAAMASRCALVTWVGMSLTETREISQAEPGFALKASIKLIRKEAIDACNDVSINELRAIADSNDDSRWLHQIVSVPGRYQMLADRRWKTIVDTGEESILRLVDKNQIVAQCNITRLPKLSPGQQLSLAGMQDDVKRSLEKNLESLLEASEKKINDLRVLRVVAIGKSAEVPVRWVYAHISDDSGRRVSLVFTMSGEASENFGMADEQMITSFEMSPDTTTTQPTPAESVTESAAKSTKGSQSILKR